LVVAAGLAVTEIPVEPLSVAAGVQVYVFAPLAVKVAVCCPTHIVPDVAVIVGVGFTVTTAVVDPVQVPEAPDIVYVMVEAGLAVTLVPEVALKPVAGLQV
jgi:hypothetical protein